jgi:uncharacterized protein
VKDAGSSIVEYERWRQQGEQSILDAIGAYNRDDCISTRRLREWLEARRDEVRAAGHDVPRPDGSVVQPAEHYREPDPEFVAAEAALTAGVPDDPTARTADQHTRALLANLLQWHRRENRAEWWEYFRVRKLTLDELVDDPATLGGLCDPVLVRQEKRSGVWRYRVPPQECRIRLGDRVDHARPGGASSSELVGLDLEQGWVELKRALVNVSHTRPGSSRRRQSTPGCPPRRCCASDGGWSTTGWRPTGRTAASATCCSACRRGCRTASR